MTSVDTWSTSTESAKCSIWLVVLFIFGHFGCLETEIERERQRETETEREREIRIFKLYPPT